MTGESFDAVIVGGGITALAAAWRLNKEGKRPLLVCDSESTGGVIRSVREGGWLLEEGPNSYSSFGSEEEEFLADIGMAGRALRKSIRKTDRYIWHSGRLHRVPTGLFPFLFSSILPFTAKLNIVSGLVGRYDPPEDEISIGRFFRNLFGDEVVETLLKPALAGIYAADADRISLDAVFPRLGEGIRKSRRLPGALKAMKRAAPETKKESGPKALTSFPEGLAELPRAVTETLRNCGVPMVLGARGVSLTRNEAGAWRVAWEGGSAEAPAVLLSTPVEAAENILMSTTPEAAGMIGKIEYAPLVVVHVGVREEELKAGREGFGFLARRDEGVRMLGSIWSSSIFPGRAPEGHRLFTCFFGGDIDPETADWPEERLREQTAADLRSVLDYRSKGPVLLNIQRWKRALPLFRPGHAKLIKDFNAALPEGVHVSTNWTGGVSIPDRIRGGWEKAALIAGADS